MPKVTAVAGENWKSKTKRNEFGIAVASKEQVTSARACCNSLKVYLGAGGAVVHHCLG
jgi:hypothetical protein